MSAAVKCADLSECCLGDDPDDLSLWYMNIVKCFSALVVDWVTIKQKWWDTLKKGNFSAI